MATTNGRFGIMAARLWTPTALQNFTLNIPPAIAVLGDPMRTLTSWDKSFNWTGLSGATWYNLEVQNELEEPAGQLVFGRDSLYCTELCSDTCGTKWPAEWRLQMAGAELWG